MRQKYTPVQKMVWWTYLFSREMRVVLLQSLFGFVSTCKHQPTCGEFFITQVEKKGIVVGGLSGLSRVLRCV